MATHENTTTRRRVLGAIVAIPATAIAAPSAIAALATIPDRSAWDSAFAAYERAKAIMRASDEDEDGEAYCDAAAELIGTPAPNHAALHWKLDYLFGETARSEEEDRSSPAWCNAYVAAVMADANRLLAS